MTAIGTNTIKAKMRITEVLKKKKIQSNWCDICIKKKGNIIERNLMMQVFLMIFYDL